MGIISDLEEIRDKLAELYESEAKDDIKDNGNLTQINNLVLSVNGLISSLKAAGREGD